MKRSLMRITCLVLVVLTLVAAAMPAMAKSSNRAFVVATSKRDRLYVHSTPSNGNVIGYLKRGTVVVYRSSKNGWWFVDFRNGEGYVDKGYLVSVAGSPKAKYKGVDNLYVHASPKMNSTVIGKLKAGKKVTVVKQSGTWSYINYKGRKGWVGSKYLFRVS